MKVMIKYTVISALDTALNMVNNTLRILAKILAKFEGTQP
jgi:hypothetical protein